MSIVDLKLVLAISRIARKEGGKIQTQCACHLRPDDVKEGNGRGPGFEFLTAATAMTRSTSVRR